MTATAPMNPLLKDSEEAGKRTGPLGSVVVVAVCLAVGQALSWVVLKVVDVDSGSVTESGLSNVIAFAPTAVLLALWVVLRERRPFPSLGFRGRGKGRKVLIGLATAVVGLIVLNVAVSAAAGGGAEDGTDTDTSAPPLSLLLLLITFAVQAPTEEMLFRGYLLPVFSNRWGAAAGVLLSSALFGLAHLVNTGATAAYALITFALGLSLSLWALADGSLWRSCAFHTVWNWAPTALSSGEGEGSAHEVAGLDGGTLTAVVCVLLLVAASALWSYRRSLRRRRA